MGIIFDSTILPRISIILPTYNGNRFLAEQLDSLLAQKKVKLDILMRDDSSADNTVAIAKEYEARTQGTCTMAVHVGPRLGVVANVGTLLELASRNNAQYFALADQDDIWYPQKLAEEIAAMHDLEGQFGSNVPLLVCSDARCVDASGKPLHNSFLKKLGASKDWGHNLQQALVMSWALGCSCLGNQALLRMALPLPAHKEIFMHDWWLLLVAQSFGAVKCLRKPLLDYRQHENNVIGDKPRKNLFQRLVALKSSALQTQRQARTFLFRYKQILTTEQSDLISNWANMPETPWLYRRWKCWQHGFRKPGIMHYFT